MVLATREVGAGRSFKPRGVQGDAIKSHDMGWVGEEVSSVAEAVPSIKEA